MLTTLLFYITDRWRDYFTDLLNIQRDMPLDIDLDLETDTDKTAEDITSAELADAISWMKRGKATGDDHLPVESKGC